MVQLNECAEWVSARVTPDMFSADIRTAFVHEICKISTISPDGIFEYNEQAYVGMLATGFARTHPESVLLLEYAVYNQLDYLGRADLYLHLEGKEYFFEAKRELSNNPRERFNRDQLDQYLKSIAYQCEKYGESNSDTCFRVPIVFEKVELGEMNVNEYFNQEFAHTDNYFQFALTNEPRKQVLWVYGQVLLVGVECR